MKNPKTIGVFLPPWKVSIQVQGIPDGRFQMVNIACLRDINHLFPSDTLIARLKFNEMMLKLERAKSQDNYVKSKEKSTINMQFSQKLMGSSLLIHN